MSSYARRRRSAWSSSRRYKRSELVPIDPAWRIARDTVLTGMAVSIVAAMLVALIWIMTAQAIDDQRLTIRERTEQLLAAQAATLAEEVRLELLLVDQSLTILQAAWRKDPAGFKLSDWHDQLPALTSVADDLFVADERRIVQQNILPHAVGQGIGSAYLNFPHGSLETFKPDGVRTHGTRIVPASTAAVIEARRFLTYVMRPLNDQRWVIGASYRAGELTRFFADAALGLNGVAALIDTSRGTLQAIAGPSSRRPRTDISKSGMYEAIRRAEAGTWSGQTAMDGAERIHGFRRVPGREIVVVVGMLASQAMMPAETLATGTQTLAGLGSLLVLAIGGSTLWALAKRRTHRRQRRADERTRDWLAGVEANFAVARTQREIADAQVRAILEIGGDGLALWDSALTLTAWNPRFAAMAGIPPAEISNGMPLDALLRKQVQAGLFGVPRDEEEEVARRVTALRAGLLPSMLPQTQADRQETLVQSRILPDGGLVMMLRSGPGGTMVTPDTGAPTRTVPAQTETVDW